MASVEKMVSLLQRRGFFIEIDDEGICVSDNSHKDDAQYLDEILRKFGIGFVKDNRVVIDNPDNCDALYEMFLSTDSIWGEQSWNNEYSWKRFEHDLHGRKVSVKLLEANIARYCKAVSACGMSTASSCDGNHKPLREKLFVVFETPTSEFWHSLLWKHILGEKFGLKWEDHFTSIRLTESNKNDIYDELNRVAEYLYVNRDRFFELKTEAVKGVGRLEKKHMSGDDIENYIENRLIENLKN